MKLIISKYTVIILCKYTIIILSHNVEHASQNHICDHRKRTARTFLYDKNTSCNILPTSLPQVVQFSVYWSYCGMLLAHGIRSLYPVSCQPFPIRFQPTSSKSSFSINILMQGFLAIIFLRMAACECSFSR